MGRTSTHPSCQNHPWVVHRRIRHAIHRWVVHRRIRHAARGVIGRIAEVDIADVSAGELFAVDVDAEAVVVDQREQIIAIVRRDGLIKFNGDGLT